MNANGHNLRAAENPIIAPLKRLAVRNGLLLDAERWQVAHDYHRQRQNLYYQALHLPGIVHGLAVTVIDPPKDVSVRYRDQRWLRVNPGVAIDLQGNLIVVDQPVNVRLAAAVDEHPEWVYLVVRYVDPERLQRSQPAEIVAETFRLDEKKQPPEALDVELCRVRLPSGDVTLAPAADVFAPALAQLDLRYRQPAQLRPQATVRAAFVPTGVASDDERIQHSLTRLMAASQSLYPALAGDRAITAAHLPSEPQHLADYDLLYITHRQCVTLPSDALAGVTHHLNRGGVVLVELPSRDSNFAEIGAIARELTTAVNDLSGSQRFSELHTQLETELASVTASLEARLSAARQALIHHFSESGLAGASLTEPDPDHPLSHSPFAFSQWPILNTEPLQIYAGSGIVLVLGDLSLAWAADREMALPREQVRAAQELGINLLQYAWQRHHWSQTQQSI